MDEKTLRSVHRAWSCSGASCVPLIARDHCVFSVRHVTEQLAPRKLERHTPGLINYIILVVSCRVLWPLIEGRHRTVLVVSAYF